MSEPKRTIGNSNTSFSYRTNPEWEAWAVKRIEELEADNKRLKDSCAYDEARCIELEAELDELKMKTLHPEAEQLVNRQTEEYKKLQAENKRLREDIDFLARKYQALAKERDSFMDQLTTADD